MEETPLFCRYGNYCFIVYFNRNYYHIYLLKKQLIISAQIANLNKNIIPNYLDEKEQRDWDLNYEKYKDNLAVKNIKLDNAASMIKAARDVGVAYGKNQPKSVTYTRIIK